MSSVGGSFSPDAFRSDIAIWDKSIGAEAPPTTDFTAFAIYEVASVPQPHRTQSANGRSIATDGGVNHAAPSSVT
ncbi:DUF6053 domain-containing protein [Lysobacter sp. TAB13]|uniref:DUF6053 domain-containing protein n=1 Tax=Lysobacter sp. TAB13 TaxID=3233065 RepID=UPI003F9589E9